LVSAIPLFPRLCELEEEEEYLLPSTLLNNFSLINSSSTNQINLSFHKLNERTPNALTKRPS